MINAILALTLLAAPPVPDLSDIPDGAVNAAEQSRHYRGATDGTQFVPSWVYLDGTGLPGPAMTRLEDALDCILVESPTAYTRLVCGLVRAGEVWRTGDEFLAYLLVREDVFKKLKDYDGNGTQASRIDLIGGKWSEMKIHAECETFFTAAQCAAAEPPMTFYRIDPELGD